MDDKPEWCALFEAVSDKEDFESPLLDGEGEAGELFSEGELVMSKRGDGVPSL